MLQSAHCCSPGSGGQPNWQPDDDVLLGQQPGQGAHRRRLGGALLAADQHAADGRVDGVEHERLAHRLLADDGGEREDGATDLHAPIVAGRLPRDRSRGTRRAWDRSHSTAQAALHAGEDRALAEVVQAEVLPAGALGEVEAGVEPVATAEELRARRSRRRRRPRAAAWRVMWSRAESMTSMRTCSAPICAASRCASSSGSSPNSEMLPRPSLMSTISGYTDASRSRSVRTTLRPGDQPVGQRGGAADGEALEPFLGEVDARGRLQDDPRAAPGEHHQRHLVAADVGVAQQRQHRALGRLHALLGVHRGAGVDDEDDQRAGAAAAHLLAEVLALEVQHRCVDDAGGGRLVATAQLVRGRGAHRGVERDVGGVLGLHRAHVAPATVGAARLAALAAWPCGCGGRAGRLILRTGKRSPENSCDGPDAVDSVPRAWSPCDAPSPCSAEVVDSCGTSESSACAVGLDLPGGRLGVAPHLLHPLARGLHRRRRAAAVRRGAVAAAVGERQLGGRRRRRRRSPTRSSIPAGRVGGAGVDQRLGLAPCADGLRGAADHDVGAVAHGARPRRR